MYKRQGHKVSLIVAVLGAFQIARVVNRHVHTRLSLWMIGLAAVAILCALSFGRFREYSQLSSLPKPTNSPNVLIIIVAVSYTHLDRPPSVWENHDSKGLQRHRSEHILRIEWLIIQPRR